MMAILRYWKWGAGVAVVAIIVALYLAWQNASEGWQAESILRRQVEVERDAANTRTAALEKAASERAVDTQERAAETDRVSDKLDRIEDGVRASGPNVIVQSDPAALAVQCSRLRRQGQTSSTLYRNRCG